MGKLAVGMAAMACLALAGTISAQDKPADPAQAPAQQQQQQQPAPQQPTFEKPGTIPDEPAPVKKAPPAPAPTPKATAAAGDESGKTVEEIIARVNNDIITRTDYNRALGTATEDATQDCQNKCTPEQLQQQIDERKKNALRDLIDQSLLVQRGKDMGLSVETDVIKQLDQIRQQNNLGSMEDLEKAVTSQGLNWEDFKNNIRNHILTQKVIQQEVGSKISIGNEDVQKYYDEHKAEFVRPEQVALREIQVNTEGKTDAQIADLRKKADTALKRVQDGEDFADIAKRMSDGPTAKEGGFLGMYKRGELAKPLEDAVFGLKRNGLTPVMETRQGFLILQVLEHYDEGQQPLAKVQNEIMDHLYNDRMQPALHDYLKTLREQSYVIIKPGFVDMAGGGNSEIQEVSATPETTKEKKPKKKIWPLSKL